MSPQRVNLINTTWLNACVNIGFACGDVLENTTGQFEFSVDTFRDQMNATVNCTWVIKASDYETIELSILDINLQDQCQNQFISVSTR